MSAPAVQTTDVTSAMAELLADVPGARTYSYVSDKTRPPTGGGAVIIGLPELDFNDSQSGFCACTWSFPITILVARDQDRQAQTQLSRLIFDVVHALSVDVDGIFSIEPLDARPGTTDLGGTPLPSYLLNVRVRA